MEDMWDIRRGDTHIKVEIQSNSEFQSLTLSPTQSAGAPCLKIDAHDTKEINFSMQLVSWSNKIGFTHNLQNKIDFHNLHDVVPPILGRWPVHRVGLY
jgi:hypothetical protein